MATLRVEDLKVGELYREPLSRYVMRVRTIARYPNGRAYKAECCYFSKVLDRHILVWLYDGELEEITPSATVKPSIR